MKTKKISHLICLILFLTQMSSPSYSQPKTEPSQNQMIYKNISYGFQFGYPKGSKLREKEKGETHIELYINEARTNLIRFSLKVTVFDKNQKNGSGVATRPGSVPSTSTAVKKGENIFLKELFLERGAGHSNQSVLYSIEKENLIIQFYFQIKTMNPDVVEPPLNPYNEKLALEIMEQIVSSFQWIPETR